MISWPAQLPQIPARDYDESLASGVIGEEDLLYGERTRTYPEYECSFSFRVTMAQWKLLRGFYNSTLAYGQLPFSAPWLTTVGFPHHFCRFLKAPELGGLSKVEDRFEAQISVEVISGVPMSGDTITYGDDA